jgi:leader peptidase (prepilin peptidase)/N-methyltransferase
MEITVFCVFFIFAVGLMIGSFLDVCIERVPREISVVMPPSHCPACSHRLFGFDLIPVLSFILLKGKCRYCGTQISFRSTAVELLTAGLFTLLYIRFGITLQILPLLVLASVLIVVSFIDIDWRIIPHGPLLFAAGAGILYSLYTGALWGVTMALFASLCGALPLYLMDIAGRLFFKKEGMGMGDVKLMAAVGPILGVQLTLFSLLAAIWICALYAVFLLVMKKQEKSGYLPFGPFLAVGCMVAVFFGDSIITWYWSLIAM